MSAAKFSRACKCGEEQSFAAEKYVLKPYHFSLINHAALKGGNIAGVYLELFAGSERSFDKTSVYLKKCVSGACKSLKYEALAAEKSRADTLVT